MSKQHESIIKKFAIPKLDFRKTKSEPVTFRDEPEHERPFEKLMRLDRLARQNLTHSK